MPFAVKDNIDVADFHTTAACKEVQYLANQDAAVVAKLKKLGRLWWVKLTLISLQRTGWCSLSYGAVKIVLTPNISAVVQVLVRQWWSPTV